MAAFNHSHFGFLVLCVVAIWQAALSMPYNNDRGQNLTDVIDGHTFFYPGDDAMYQEGLFEGDIAGGMGIVKDENGKDTYAAIIPGGGWGFWPSRTLYYEFHSSVSSTNRALILSAMAEMSQRTGCIRFENRNGCSGISNYVLIRSDTAGCWSYVGRNGAGPQQLSLQANGCMWRGIVIHELMHALGIFHQQSRPDRDNFVRIQLQNLISQSYAHNFAKYTTSQVNTYSTPYDIRSIMHYGLTAFARPGTRTIVPIGIYANINPAEVGQRNFMGPQDIAILRRAYQC